MMKRRRPIVTLTGGLLPAPLRDGARAHDSQDAAGAGARVDRVMVRRKVVIAVAGSFLGAPFVATAQQPGRIYRVGYFRVGQPPKPYFDAFEQGLRRLGYVPGRNIVIESRFADDQGEALPRLADELVNLNVDVLVVSGGLATKAAKDATRTIPIVMAAASDPVGSGLVASLSRPGGNITGTTLINPELAGKRMELLKQALPNVRRVAVLVNKKNLAHASAFKETQAAAAALGLTVQALEVQRVADFEAAFATTTNGRVEAIIVLTDSMFESEWARIRDLLARYKLPAMYGTRRHVDAGALMAYGPSLIEAHANAAVFVDKILRGAKPADLPVEQPTRFELAINLKTAKELGITIPQSLLLRADEVIQ